MALASPELSPDSLTDPRAGQRPARGRSGAPASGPLRVLLITEGTYPYAVGGVSSWCDLLVSNLPEFHWQVLPITAAHGKEPVFELPGHATQVGRIEVWSELMPAGGRRHPLQRGFDALPATLVRSLMGWDGDTDALVKALVWCRRHPAAVRQVFRSRRGWRLYLDALRAVLEERIPEAGAPPKMDLVEAATLYQTLYWIARTASEETPETDVLHITAAGWSCVPALVHKALHGTPMVLTEHGVYVRESYLAAIRNGGSPGTRFAQTRLARGLARAAYASADVVSPVTDVNGLWEQGLGIDPRKIRVIYNGMRRPDRVSPPPGTRTVVSVGRIDPLKDIHTMLRVAEETLRTVPDAQFLHYGPVTDGEEDYGRSCEQLHAQLGLGDRFRFMGRTSDPNGAVRDADVMLMTSISEGLPMSVLEAMGQGRPVVTTGVGGVPDVVKGCGVVTAPGDTHGLAMGVATLLRSPGLAERLGLRGYDRLGRLFSEASCIDGYRDLLSGIGSELDAPARPAEPRRLTHGRRFHRADTAGGVGAIAASAMAAGEAR